MTGIGKASIITAGLLALVGLSACASQSQWRNVLGNAGNTTSQSTATVNALSNSDIVAGLKNALANGTTHAINSLGKPGGFWNSSQFHIPLPSSLDKAAKLARNLGQGAKVDAFEHSLNSAAEKAVPAVADIFGDAIRSMTLNDARGILSGGDYAATDYFKRVASQSLQQRIEPIVAKATDSVDVTRKYNALTGNLGGVLSALGGKSSQAESLDLNQYITDKAINALFTEIANQEKAIRENPAARTTSILKKVFGNP